MRITVGVRHIIFYYRYPIDPPFSLWPPPYGHSFFTIAMDISFVKLNLRENLELSKLWRKVRVTFQPCSYPSTVPTVGSEVLPRLGPLLGLGLGFLLMQAVSEPPAGRSKKLKRVHIQYVSLLNWWFISKAFFHKKYACQYNSLPHCQNIAMVYDVAHFQIQGAQSDL